MESSDPVAKKVLIVEDNALNLRLFCDLVAAHGHIACGVADEREALERMRRFRPDLIVMDIQLPHVSGLELIAAIRADPLIRDTPVLAVTAYAAKGDEERICAAGAQAYVSKPMPVARFVAAVEALL